MIRVHLSVVPLILLGVFGSSNSHMYYAVQDQLRTGDPLFQQMSVLALEKYGSHEPLKVVSVKNVYDDHNQGRKYHLIFTAGSPACLGACIPKLECAAHIMKSENGAIAVQEVVCNDIPPGQAEQEHALN
ncbi:uncharacterized protein LOC113226502 [Hyposmocoma kahamanoa]|uniref:uncharacterized protein LOC113226502 n=1 Tax=Hyposmocoma kahamanoa TaxID=1477025 RepID=UPI000E6D9E32|nr:uncharacterized protein LOC113226502 [Hyposmocoma kahamanoa]